MIGVRRVFQRSCILMEPLKWRLRQYSAVFNNQLSYCLAKTQDLRIKQENLLFVHSLYISIQGSLSDLTPIYTGWRYVFQNPYKSLLKKKLAVPWVRFCLVSVMIMVWQRSPLVKADVLLTVHPPQPPPNADVDKIVSWLLPLLPS